MLASVTLDDLLATHDRKRQKVLSVLEQIKSAAEELASVVTEIYLIHVGPLRRFAVIAADR